MDSRQATKLTRLQEGPVHRLPRIVSLAFLISACAATNLWSQQLQPHAIPSQRTESYRFASPVMGRNYDITVGLPESYADSVGKRYPMLLVTDGDDYFPLVFNAANTVNGIDEVIVVSVGAPFEEGRDAFTRRRVHEFSPPNWTMNDPFGQYVLTGCKAWKLAIGDCVGGAPKFLGMIVDELLPRVSAKYRIDKDRLGLFGVSAGGFFASWAIFQDKSPFHTYIISSPAMAYGDGDALRQEAHYAESHKDLAARIYLSSGTLEIDDPQLEGIGHIVSGTARLSAALRGRKYPGLTMFSESLQGLGHTDAPSTAAVRGMRLLYAK
ncbi:MAG: alpha/beta hydrolase-fold protein [Gemmatimonadaceae bacterium]